MKNEQVSAADFKNKSLFITTPCYGGLVYSNFALGLSILRVMLNNFNIKHDIFFINNDSLITRARNSCMARFMSEDYTHMIFIDADTEFNPTDVLKFLYSDEDILTGPVPQKTLPIIYNTALVKDEKDEVIMHNDRFLEVEHAGTAFMMIKRSVFEKMFESYPDLKYEPTYEVAERLSFSPEKALKFIENSYALFDTAIDIRPKVSEKPRYVAEDYMFCRRWTDIGGKILLDPSVKLNHIGTYTFKGDLSKL